MASAISVKSPAVSRPRVRRFRTATRRFFRNYLATFSLIVVLLLLLASIIGPFLLPSPTHADVGNKLAMPSQEHLLGTDELGRDLLARILAGGRVSFFVAIMATVLSVVPAGILGITAGYFSGWVDGALGRTFDILLAVPTLLLTIVIVAAIGPTMTSIIVAISIADIPRYGRLFRALTMEVKETEFVKGAIALGYTNFRVAVHHILPNIYISIMVVATGHMGKVALAEGSLSFLGVGIQPPQASWGNIIAEGQHYLRYFPIIALSAGIALTAMTLAFAFVGDGLRDAFDVREQGRRS